MPKWIDRTGMRYGRLTCIEYLGNRIWLCRCDCGNTCTRNGGHLTHRSSCGCMAEYLNKEYGLMRTKHGDSRTKLYKRWTAMHQRCENPKNAEYKNYGGRGISVCNEWSDYVAFREWALSHGYREGLSIDRIDVNGNYEPDNCRWTTASVQLSNRRPYNRKELWKPVEALDENGGVVERFDCIKDAIKWLNGKTKLGTGISNVLNGKQLTAYGYRWRYASA